MFEDTSVQRAFIGLRVFHDETEIVCLNFDSGLGDCDRVLKTHGKDIPEGDRFDPVICSVHE